MPPQTVGTLQDDEIIQSAIVNRPMQQAIRAARGGHETIALRQIGGDCGAITAASAAAGACQARDVVIILNDATVVFKVVSVLGTGAGGQLA